MIRALWLALALALATPAHATVVYLTGFEDASPTADVFTAPETDGASSEAGDLSLTTDRDHTDTNGGHASGRKAALVDVTTGESRYYSLPAAVTLSTNAACATVNAHLTALPSAEWTFLEFRMGANRGVYARFTTSGTVKVYYATTGTVLGETGTVLRAKACSGDPFRGCSVDGDCITPQTCVACTASTSVGCFMPSIEVCQANTFDPGGTLVTATVYVNGVQEVAGTPTSAASLAAITDVRLGAPETEAASRSAYLDDWVVATGTRAGHGWVATATTTANASIQWTAPNCGGGATNWQCLDDWTNGGSYDSDALDGTTRATAAGKTDNIRLAAVTPGDATVDAVAYVVTGRTSADNGTYNYETALLVCPTASTCVPTPAKAGTTGQATSHKLLGYEVAPTAPGATPAWNATTLGQLGVQYAATTVPNNANLRVGGVLAYVHGVLPDDPPPRNLRDHNLGTNDGVLAWYGVGDSLCSATNQQTCQGGSDQGKPCAQESACSWSIAAGVGDRPVGGCTTNAQCQTCTARRDETPNGAGFPCAGDSGCGNSQTCDTGLGVCSVNANVPCATDSDCQGLGTCATTATCDDTCVGGTCPSITGWPGGMVGKIDVDVLVACGLGNEPSWNLVDNRIAGILQGNHASCLAIVGTGQCGCSSATDCAAAGGTCTNGVCTAGDTARVQCTTASQCAATFACRFPPPDGVVVLSSANDFAPGTAYGVAAGTVGWKSAANCNEPGSLVYAYNHGEACDAGGSYTLCNDDGDCSGISPTSTCVGVTRGDGGLPCAQQALASLFAGGTCAGGVCDCSVQSYACRSSADCPDGLTCSTNTPTAERFTGFCQCTADAQCGDTNTWKCMLNPSSQPGWCRRKGTSDATCSSPTRGGSYDSGNGVCYGVCTTPCDRTTCTTSADCPVKSYPNAKPGPITYRGDCVAGRCANCGPEPCSRDSATATAHARWAAPFLAYGMTYQMRRIQQMIDLTPDTDGRPLLIPVNQPEYSKTYFCPLSTDTTSQATLVCARGERPVPLSEACTLQTGIPDWGYAAHHSRRMVDELPHAVDLRTVMGRDRCRNLGLSEACGLHSDGIHFRPRGADLTGTAITDVIGALNTCVTGAAPFYVRQKYCQEPDGDWVTTPSNGTCSTNSDCTGGATCKVRTCLAASATTDDTAAGCPGTAICNLE